MSERRDLQGLVVVTASGHEAVCPKGGVPNARAGIDVPVRYREQPLFALSLPYDTDAKAVGVAVRARAEAVDDMLAAQEAEVRRKPAERLGLGVQAATAMTRARPPRSLPFRGRLSAATPCGSRSARRRCARSRPPQINASAS